MKIIQVVGLANTGKTTFIKNLVPALNAKGTVAVVKHLGDHEFLFEDGKDTTDFFDAGAMISAGIDANKSVIAIRDNSLDTMLSLFYAQRIDFAIIEGFKQRQFPKIVIGDLPIANCVLRDPEIHEVMQSLHLFDEFNSKNCTGL